MVLIEGKVAEDTEEVTQTDEVWERGLKPDKANGDLWYRGELCGQILRFWLPASLAGFKTGCSEPGKEEVKPTPGRMLYFHSESLPLLTSNMKSGWHVILLACVGDSSAWTEVSVILLFHSGGC